MVSLELDGQLPVDAEAAERTYLDALFFAASPFIPAAAGGVAPPAS